jgi:hypothetical protein
MSWLHVHLAVNHLPIVGLPLLLLILFLGRLRRQEAVVQMALGLLVLTSIAAVGVKYTGDFAAADLPLRLVTKKAGVALHEHHGDQATTAVFLFGLLTAAAWLRCRPYRPPPVWVLHLILLAGAATTLLYLRTAASGGHLSHPEISPPMF